jgi:hypothetical protein
MALPRDSLVIAALLDELGTTLITHNLASQAIPNSPAAAELMELPLRSFHLLDARWQAGMLFAPTAEETAYFVEGEYPPLPAQMCGAYFYIHAAELVAKLQVFAPCTTAEAEARVQGLCGALRATLEMDARGMLDRHPRTGQAWPASSAASKMVSLFKISTHRLVTLTLCDEAGLLLRMRATCNLSPAEETDMRQLAERYKAEFDRNEQELPKTLEESRARRQQAAAADAARHGLRRCALPACDAQEPHPKLFKLCGRCRDAAYCCPAHSVEDWKRHKREDGCAAAP